MQKQTDENINCIIGGKAQRKMPAVPVLQKFKDEQELPVLGKNATQFLAPKGFLQTNQSTIQRQVIGEDGNELSIDEFIKIGEERGIRDVAGLIAMCTDGQKHSISEALQIVYECQFEGELMNLKDYAYDSDGLDEGDMDVDKHVELKRKKGVKPGVVMQTESGMKKIALVKRKMLMGKSTPQDKVPIVMDTTGGGNFFEFQPNSFRKDVGAYKLGGKDDAFERDGGAKPYEKLGREMDSIIAELKMTYADANEILLHAFYGEDISKILSPKAASLFGELVAILLTDMSRGSGAIVLILEMLSSNTSFFSRLKEGGTYAPASKGGVKEIRSYTDDSKF